jgi:hypothetical protein
MRALWDLHPLLPYQAVAPWPIVETRGHPDWIASVFYVESWLNDHIGSHFTDWTWYMWNLESPHLCGVGFRKESNCTLFLLKFS